MSAAAATVLALVVGLLLGVLIASAGLLMLLRSEERTSAGRPEAPSTQPDASEQ